MTLFALSPFLYLLVSVFPVVLFLGCLIYLDSFKLIRFRSVLLTLAAGIAAAGASFLGNRIVGGALEWDTMTLSRYGAPVIEELFKAGLLFFLIKRRRIGFAVDAAICGFAIGTGFAVVENAWFLATVVDGQLFAWVVRGFGTAIMHGGSTAVLGIVTEALAERYSARQPLIYLPGLLLAASIHSVFNHLAFLPVVSTIFVLISVPLLVVFVFNRSEEALRSWLGSGFDTDLEILRLIKSGKLTGSPIGKYLHSLKARFSGVVIADMLCYLRLNAELSIRAKGILIMRESGFAPQKDEAIRQKLDELHYLEKSIGRMGQLAIAPLLRNERRETWQMNLLEE